MTRTTATMVCLLASATIAGAEDFRHVGDYLLESHFKLTGGQLTPIPVKPVVFRVWTDGLSVRVSADGNDEAVSTFEIYRSDGIGRQRPDGAAFEVIPGLQAMSRNQDVLRHLRLSTESLTMTTFPGVSDQTVVTHAVATTTEPAAEEPAEAPAPTTPQP